MTRVRSTAKALFAALLALALTPSLAALEAKEGLVKIVVDEANARVALYRLADVAKGRYEPFYYDEDTRTTFATLSFDGKQAKLGDAADYRFSVSRTDSGVLITFRSSFCVVRQAFDFAKSAGAALADGVRVSFELENVSEREAKVGLRYLLDTCLAEKTGLHFATDKSAKLGGETVIDAGTGEVWIATPGDRVNFMVQIGGEGVDRPDKVVAANWKRISDASWSFEPNAQRNFTLAPYSINDSALALFWEAQSLQRGATRRVAFFMGAFNQGGFVAQVSRSPVDRVFAATVLEGAPADAATALAADLVSVRDLITRIDRAIASGSASPEEIAAWMKILDRLEERKKDY